MSRKAQITTIDLIIAFTLVILILLQNYYIWGEIQNRLQNTGVRYYFETDLRNVVETLISIKGEPINWESLGTINDNTVKLIGLAKTKNELDNTKLQKLIETSYEDIKTTLFPSGHIHIEIINESGTIYSFGPDYYGSVARVDRQVIINNSVYKFSVWGWRA